MIPTKILSDIPEQASLEELRACEFKSWYSSFRNEDEKNTPKSRIVSLSKEFIEYLLSNNVKLPLCCRDQAKETSDDDDWDSEEVYSDETSPHSVSSSEENEKEYSFPELTDKINAIIKKELGGSVFPKLNFSSPRDAVWITFNKSLECKNASDVYLLLKASDFITWDLLHSGIHKSNENLHDSEEEKEDSVFYLVLRRWCNLNPSSEFRCFVYQQEIVAISQRNHTIFYPHLLDQLEEIKRQILEFFHACIQSKFPLLNYIFDCYIAANQRIWIIDFNCFCTSTDSLLFTWDEVTDLAEKGIEMRIVTKDEKRISMDPLSSYRAPVDAVALACSDHNINFESFMELCKHH